MLLALSCTVGLRMLGLFLVLPVFTLYGLQFTKSRFLVGFAFGCYGLTMALLQIPLGRLSDHIGRRKVLILGMALFSIGSFICAVPHWFPAGMQIGALIAGRLVQGCGAIVSVAFATVADQIESDRRSTAMAVLGIPIGGAFVLGIIGGPVLAGWFGISFLFWLTGLLGILSDFLLIRYLPDAPPSEQAPAPLRLVLRKANLLSLDGSGFIINFFMSAFFFYFPLIITGEHHLDMRHYYEILLPMVLVSGITMFAFTRGADKGYAKPLTVAAFLIFIPSAILLFKPGLAGFSPNHLAGVIVAGSLFYIAFTGLEPILPSMVSNCSPANSYGSALGVYNSMQFFGSFAGGSLAGALAHYAGATPIMVTLIVAAILGFLLVLPLRLETSGVHH